MVISRSFLLTVRNAADKPLYRNVADKQLYRNAADKQLYRNAADKQLYRNVADKQLYIKSKRILSSVTFVSSKIVRFKKKLENFATTRQATDDNIEGRMHFCVLDN